MNPIKILIITFLACTASLNSKHKEKNPREIKMLRILLCMLSVLPAVPGAIQLPDGQLELEFSSFNTGKHTF